jgi:hypothetical protein
MQLDSVEAHSLRPFSSSAIIFDNPLNFDERRIREARTYHSRPLATLGKRLKLRRALGSRRWLQRENPSHSIAVVRLPDCGGEQGCVRYETYCIGNFIRRGVIEHPSVANLGPVPFVRSSTTNIQRGGIARVCPVYGTNEIHARGPRE